MGQMTQPTSIDVRHYTLNQSIAFNKTPHHAKCVQQPVNSEQS